MHRKEPVGCPIVACEAMVGHPMCIQRASGMSHNSLCDYDRESYLQFTLSIHSSMSSIWRKSLKNDTH